MVDRKKGGEKGESTKQIAASIRKPVLPTANKLEQALAFAQKSPLPVEAVTESAVVSVSPAISRETEFLPQIGQAHDKVSAWSLMPQGDGERKVLQTRAKIFAKQEQYADGEVREQYIRFRLGESALYGVSYTSMEEILSAVKVSRVPCTPEAIAGIVNYRGELLTVLDLRKVFRLKHDARMEKSWILVIKEGALRAGLLVDEVDDNDEFPPAQLSPPLDGSDLVRGIHQGRVVILNAGAIFNHPALNVDESVS